MSFVQDQSFTRTGRADVAGRMVLDGISLVRDAFITLDDYTLETAARTLLGRGKLIREPMGNRGAEIQRPAGWVRIFGCSPVTPNRPKKFLCISIAGYRVSFMPRMICHRTMRALH